MLKVFVTRGFPFWDAENRLYITEQPTEVQDSEWLQAQIEAGLIAVAEEEQADTPKRGRGKAASEPESTEKTE